MTRKHGHIRLLRHFGVILLLLSGCAATSVGSVKTACRLFYQPFEFHEKQDVRTRAWGMWYQSVWLINCKPELYERLKKGD